MTKPEAEALDREVRQMTPLREALRQLRWDSLSSDVAWAQVNAALEEVEGEVKRLRETHIQWRCFHCGETFTEEQERWACEHFGRDEGELPVCQMRIPGEHHLLAVLRKAQDELSRYRAEDGDLMRAMYAMQADHAEALRREEERGYAKGVADSRALNPGDKTDG